ncbi:hypothetical protein GCM10028820_12350 [Tessaracoccus terricola]
MQPVVDAFTAANPEITVEIQTVPFDDLNSVIQSRVGGQDENVDVYMVDKPRLAGLASQDMLLDLTDKVEIPDGALLEAAGSSWPPRPENLAGSPKIYIRLG